MTQTNMQLDGELEGPTSPLNNHQDNVSLDDILEVFEEYHEVATWKNHDTLGASDVYHELKEEVVKDRLPEVSNHIIQSFIDRIGERSYEYLNRSVGLFITELVDNCPDKVVELDISNIPAEVDKLGTHLEGRELRITGTAGSWLGYKAKNSIFVADHALHSTGTDSESCAFIANSFGDVTGRTAKNSFFAAKEYGRETGYYSHSLTFIGKKYGIQTGSRKPPSSLDDWLICVGDTFEIGAGWHSENNFYLSKTFVEAGTFSEKSYFLGKNFNEETGSGADQSHFIGEKIVVKLSPRKKSTFIADKYEAIFYDSEARKEVQISMDPFFSGFNEIRGAYYPWFAKKIDELHNHPHFKAIYADDFVEYFRNNLEGAKKWAQETKAEMIKAIEERIL